MATCFPEQVRLPPAKHHLQTIDPIAALRLVAPWFQKQKPLGPEKFHIPPKNGRIPRQHHRVMSDSRPAW